MNYNSNLHYSVLGRAGTSDEQLILATQQRGSRGITALSKKRGTVSLWFDIAERCTANTRSIIINTKKIKQLWEAISK